jgi:hypothetical protein
MIDIDIVIEGGEELEEYYPKNYEAFQEKIGDLIVEMFPGVGGWAFRSELTKDHRVQKQERERLRKEEFKEALIRVLQEPEFQDELRTVIGGEAPAS